MSVARRFRRRLDRRRVRVYPLATMQDARDMYADRAVTGLITPSGWLKATPAGPACACVS